MGVLADPVNEVKLDATFRHPINYPRNLLLDLAVLLASVLIDFNKSIIPETSSQTYFHYRWLLGSPSLEDSYVLLRLSGR